MLKFRQLRLRSGIGLATNPPLLAEAPSPAMQLVQSGARVTSALACHDAAVARSLQVDTKGPKNRTTIPPQVGRFVEICRRERPIQ